MAAPLSSEWTEAHRMAVGAPREQDEATRLRERSALRKIVLMHKAAHVLPVALIQFTDFASDAMVIVQLATMEGAGADWIACLVAVGLSLLVACLFLGFGEQLSTREKLIGCVLACANLHVLYVGTRFISAIYEGQKDKAEKLYTMFVRLKMYETGIESVVLGLVTAGAFVRSLDGGSGLALFASSLALSLLSMAYGFFGNAANENADALGGRRPALFLCLLVHLCWGVAAFGTLAAAGGPWWLLGLGAMVALAGVRNFFEAKAHQGGLLERVGNTLLFTLNSGLPLVLVDSEFLGGDDLPTSQRVAFAAARRALLFGVAATGLALSPNTAIAAVLAALLVADLLCSPHAHRLIGKLEWDPLSFLLVRCIRPAARGAGAPTLAARPAAAESPEPGGAARPAASGDRAALLDMLDAIIKQCAAPPKGAGAAGVARPHGTDELGAEAEGLRAALLTEPDALSPGALLQAVNAVGEYRPWEEGAQRALVAELRGRHSTALAETPAARPRVKHPLRALPLAEGLSTEVWATKPSFFGSQPTGTNYDLSHDATYVDFFVRRPPFAPPAPRRHRSVLFTTKPTQPHHVCWSPPPPLPQVSHAWQDGHERKVQMLRAFLCLDALLAQAGVVALLLAAFLLPLGTGINVWVHSFPWWALSMLPLALLAFVLQWVALSRLGAVPRAWRPWALSPRTIWLDKCCIMQSPPEMMMAGVSSFGVYLADCDNMVAFTSPTYFSRLW